MRFPFPTLVSGLMVVAGCGGTSVSRSAVEPATPSSAGPAAGAESPPAAPKAASADAAKPPASAPEPAPQAPGPASGAATFKPPAVPPSPPPDAPPGKLFTAYCGACHSLQLAQAQKLDRANWEWVMKDMVVKYGAGFIHEAEQKILVDYLVEHYGPAPRLSGGLR